MAKKKKSPKKSLVISNEYFETFKETFLYWQKEFGLLQYQIQFEHEDLGGPYATICVRESTKFAHVTCATKYTTQQTANGRRWPGIKRPA